MIINTSTNNILTTIVPYHVGFKDLLHCYARLSNKLFHYKGNSASKIMVHIFVAIF